MRYHLTCIINIGFTRACWRCVATLSHCTAGYNSGHIQRNHKTHERSWEYQSAAWLMRWRCARSFVAKIRLGIRHVLAMPSTYTGHGLRQAAHTSNQGKGARDSYARDRNRTISSNCHHTSHCAPRDCYEFQVVCP